MTTSTQTLAAVDLGSNSFHMLLARIDGDQVRVIDRHKDMVRLASGLLPDGSLSAESRERALNCLQQFGQPLKALPPENVRVVGTNTLRSAKHAEAFLEEAETALGHPIEIVSGREEARLVYLGVAHSQPVDGHQRLVIDIGGGSTELIVGRDFETLLRESVRLGCVSSTRQFFDSGTLKRKYWHRAVLNARLELLPLVSQYAQLGWEYGIGASGTMRSIGAVLKANNWSNGDITLEGIESLEEAVFQFKSMDDLKLEGLSSDRQPVFVGGFAVVRALFEALGLERLQIAQGALREGLLYDLSGRLEHDNVRTRTIKYMKDRFVTYPAQSERVRATSVRLLKMASDSCGLAKRELQLLKWAAELHDVGLQVAHSGYHKHGAYFVRYADMPGFSQSEQQDLALLIRCQRGKLNKKLLAQIPEVEWLPFVKMVIVLRLALLIKRDRKDEWIPLNIFQSNGQQVRLIFDKGYLESHPLTQFDLEQEAKQLAKLEAELEFA